MALTARGGVLALLGALVVGLVWPSGLAVLVITGLIVVGIGVDIVLAPSVRRLVLRRDGDTAVRLGERATVSLLVANPGSRRVRGRLRDAWPPSAGALDDRHPLDTRG